MGFISPVLVKFVSNKMYLLFSIPQYSVNFCYNDSTKKKGDVCLNREHLYKLVDAVPNDKLKELEKMLKIMAMLEEVPTEEEIEEIRLGEEEIPQKKTKQTASKEDILAIYKKIVKTHGNTLERLSKN